MAESLIHDLDFGESDESSGVITKDVELYTGQRGRTDRIALIYRRQPITDDQITPAIKKAIDSGDKEIIERNGKKFLVSPWVVGGMVHYSEEMGRFFCLTKRKNGRVDGKKEVCCDNGDPRAYFASLIIHYYTDKDGNPKKPLNYEIKIWRFSEDKYKSLRKKNMVDESRKLVKGDILATCQEEQYQRMDLDLTTKAIWRVNNEVEDRVYAEAESISDGLERVLGRKQSKEVIMEKMGKVAPEITSQDLSDPSADDFSGLLES